MSAGTSVAASMAPEAPLAAGDAAGADAAGLAAADPGGVEAGGVDDPGVVVAVPPLQAALAGPLAAPALGAAGAAAILQQGTYRLLCTVVA